MDIFFKSRILRKISCEICRFTARDTRRPAEEKDSLPLLLHSPDHGHLLILCGMGRKESLLLAFSKHELETDIWSRLDSSHQHCSTISSCRYSS